MGRSGSSGDRRGLMWQVVTSLPPGPELVTALVRLTSSPEAVDDAGAVAIAAAWQRAAVWMLSRRDDAAAEVADRFRARPVDLMSTLPHHRPGRPRDPGVERVRRLRRVATSMAKANASLYALTRPVSVDPETGEVLIDDALRDVDESALLADAIAVASAAGEVALAAGVSDGAAREWITTSRMLASGRLPRAAEAVAQGLLDRGKTRDLVAATRDLSPETAAVVDASVVAHGRAPEPETLATGGVVESAGLRAASAFKDAVTAAVLAADPAAAAERAARRRRDRSVTIRPVDETLARLEWLLPIERAAHVKVLLDAGVQAVRAAYREARRAARVAAEAAGRAYQEIPVPSADEIRDDVMYDLLTTDTVPGLRRALLDDTLTPTDSGPDGEPDTEAPASAGPTETAAPCSADATPADATPADATPADATPADATPADATPADATPADATPADATPADATPADATPADATPADATPADATPADATPADATPADATPADATPADATPADAAPADAAPADAAPADAAPADATPAAGDGRRSPVQVIVHVPFDVLFGYAQHPGLIEGAGPITADLARSMAADADWRCAVTDPDHGTVLGLGRRTYTPAYTPTVGLRRLLAVSQHSCGKPGCRVRAQHCDVDHLVNHPAGATCSCNTELKCRRDHLLKTFAGWTTTASTRPDDPPGTVIWTTPAGFRYAARPTALPSGTGSGLTPQREEHPAAAELRLWKAQLAAVRDHHARHLAHLGANPRSPGGRSGPGLAPDLWDDDPPPY